MIAVTIIPTSRPKMGFVNNVNTFPNSGLSANGAIEEDIKPIPNIKTANPTRNVPIFFLFERLFFDVIIIITPNKARTGQKDSGFRSLKKKFELCMPDKLKIQDVIVVPTFDPIIMPIDCDNFIIPELTNPTSITVTAEEL